MPVGVASRYVRIHHALKGHATGRPSGTSFSNAAGVAIRDWRAEGYRHRGSVDCSRGSDRL
jgi:hypothetical protein